MTKGTEGIVIDKQGGKVKVRIYRAAPCNDCSCGLSEACDPADPQATQRRGFFEILGGSNILEIEALNQASAELGDRCLVNLRDDTAILKGSLLLYLIPGILFMVGLFVGGIVGESYWGLSGDSKILAQLLGGLILMGLAWGFAAVYGKLRARSEFMPIVTKTVSKLTSLQVDKPKTCQLENLQNCELFKEGPRQY